MHYVFACYIFCFLSCVPSVPRFCFYLILFSCFFFFFSSRRRHTRCLSDWSSDVCSSDLAGWLRCGGLLGRSSGSGRRSLLGPYTASASLLVDVAQHVLLGDPAPKTRARSEERRVGKEGR